MLIELLTGIALLGQTGAQHSPLLVRHGSVGDRLAYHMTCVNQGEKETIRYSADAVGEVTQGADGHLGETFGWSNLVWNGHPLELPPASVAFRQTLSLDPDNLGSFPDLSRVSPNLIGPVTDLLTFYVDLRLAMGFPQMAKAGDHVFVPFGRPSSWADGTYVLVGEDAIDFDVTLKSVDRRRDLAVVVVRHVPSAKPNLKMQADWMRVPVADTPNNWVEVSKNPSGGFTAGVGKETFDVEIKVRLSDGKMLSATQDNVVEVLERQCPDLTLPGTGKPTRYRIHRRIKLVSL